MFSVFEILKQATIATISLSLLPVALSLDSIVMFTTDFRRKLRNKLASRQYAVQLTNEGIDAIKKELEKEDGISTRIISTFVTLENGITLHVVDAGNENGKVVILNHGFPELWYSFHKLIPFFVRNGFRAIIPDLRGYNLSDKPDGIHNYNGKLLAKDISLLISHFSPNSPAILIGHDWGGLVAWQTAMDYPEKISKLVVMSSTHPQTYVDVFKKSWVQRFKSWYTFLLQIPRIPEALMATNPLRFSNQLIPNIPKNSNSYRAIEMRACSWLQNTNNDNSKSKSNAMTCMINYYRAAFRQAFSKNTDKNIIGPTLLSNECKVIYTPTIVIWGDRDQFGSPDLAGPSLKQKLVPNLQRVEIIKNADHWILENAPKEIEKVLTDFLINE